MCVHRIHATEECEIAYENKFAEKCAHCGEALLPTEGRFSGEVVVGPADGKPYHRECEEHIPGGSKRVVTTTTVTKTSSSGGVSTTTTTAASSSSSTTTATVKVSTPNQVSQLGD